MSRDYFIEFLFNEKIVEHLLGKNNYLGNKIKEKMKGNMSSLGADQDLCEKAFSLNGNWEEDIEKSIGSFRENMLKGLLASET